MVTRKDEEKNPRGSTSCVTLVVNKSSHPTIQHTIVAFESETLLLDGLATHLRTTDPDVVVGFETQNGSIGYILERAQVLGHSFAQMASRWLKGGNFDANRGATSNSAAAAYYHRKGADIKITGRHVLSLWRIVRTEVKLPAYSREAVAFELFSTTFPKLNNNILEEWFSSSKQFERAILHLERTASLNVAIVDKLNILGRTGELARVFGIDFMSVLTRGSQFRVESMMRRVSRARNYVLLAAPREEVYRQPAVEALPLVMEPQSALYVDPVIVLDFQSLYPSMIIAHNLCFSTMLGNVNRISSWNEQRRIGVKTTYNPPTPDQINGLDGLYIASNGEMFVDASVRRGILPQLLEEILETRVMVKTAMKNIINDDATANMLNARQFGLKMIANVTYGYTSASFSGRMPCSGLADTIVQSGRDALEEMIRYVEDELREETGATVVYGDTDSLFVRVPGATRDEAFGIGERIVKKAQEKFPDPVTLKLEKVYQPCLLQSKKRYVGYAYETRNQAIASFDAKGIETIRRDACPLVQKALEKTLRILFETRDISLVKRYVQRLCNRLQEGRIPFTDLIFRKEVKLGRYKEGHLPPAAIVASKSIDHDARRTPRHGERVPFVVIYERAGAPLKECVVSPEMYISGSMQGGMRLNTTYYITKQILPALNRALSLVGIRVATWYAEMPRRTSLYESSGLPGRKTVVRNGQSNLKMFYNSNICRICHGNGGFVCEKCKSGEKGRQSTQYILAYRLQQAERTYNKLRRKCVECAGRVASEECINLDCDTNDAMKVTKRRMQLGWEVMQ